jgi:hypothetical protein
LPDALFSSILQPVANKARSWLYNVLVVLIAGLSFVVFRTVVFEDGKKKNQLSVMAAQLRRQRAAAKRCQEEVVTMTGEFSVSGGKAIRYLISGPLTAQTVVLLHAEDGETAAMWGFVHRALADVLLPPRQQAAAAMACAAASAPTDFFPPSAAALGGVCIVSFHRTKVAAAPGRTVPTSLRLRDADAMMRHLRKLAAGEGQSAASPSGSSAEARSATHPAASAGSGWLSWGGSSGPRPASHRPGPRQDFLLVSHGEGAWGNLAFCGMHAPSSGAQADTAGDLSLSGSDSPSTTGGSGVDGFAALGSVCVAPVLMHRGESMAWWDALAGASRVTPATDPGVLQRLLDPPPQQLDEALLEAADATSTTRQRNLKFSDALGLGTGSGMEAQSKRLAEDVRRSLARQPILSASDGTLLAEFWRRPELCAAPPAAQPPVKQGAASAAPCPAVRPLPVSVVTHGFASMPPFIPASRSLATEYWWLQPALAVGLFTAGHAQLAELAAFREANTADVMTEMSGGRLRAAQQPGTRDAAAAAAPAAAGAAAEGAAAPRLSGAAMLKLAALGGTLLKDTATGLTAGDAEARFVQRALAQLPQTLGLRALPPTSQTFTYLAMQRELRILQGGAAVVRPAAASAAQPGDPEPLPTTSGATVGALPGAALASEGPPPPDAAPSADFAITLVQAPTARCRVFAPGQLDFGENAETVPAVAHIPLQAPDAVTHEVLRLLHLQGRLAQADAHTAAAQLSPAPVGPWGRFRFYGEPEPVPASADVAEGVDPEFARLVGGVAGGKVAPAAITLRA